MNKVKILILPKSTNKKFINSHIPWMKYFILITLKSDIWSEEICISHTKLLVQSAGFTVWALDHRVNTKYDSPLAPRFQNYGYIFYSTEFARPLARGIRLPSRPVSNRVSAKIGNFSPFFFSTILYYSWRRGISAPSPKITIF